MPDEKHISMFNDGFSHFRESNPSNEISSKAKSRYSDDYNELETFGKGYFGKVVRC